MAGTTDESRTTGAALGSAVPSPAASESANAKDAEKLRFIEEMTSDVDSVQERVLAEILARNAGTEYLSNCGLDGRTDRATFRAKVPVVSYDALQPYIQRIANGDRSPVLSTRPVSEFFTSSGTSAGECKLMPTVEDEHDRRQMLSSIFMAVMNLYMPGLDKGKGLYFFVVKPETRTPSGLMARPVLTSYYKNEQLKKRPYRPYRSYTSPTADVFQSMYAQMLCGLCQRHDVLLLGAVFAAGLLRAIRFLQLKWEQLAADIEAGTLTPRVTDASVRQAVAGIIRPDPELSRFVRDECCNGDWAGIVTRVWPNTKYVDVIVTGAMAQYIPILRHYCGNLPLVSGTYGSSECYFGINLRPLCDPPEVAYTMMPNMGYFEFLPVDDDDEAAGDGEAAPRKLVDLARVEAGREYELVITTYVIY
ncbi:hypothetical protein ACQ4PT_052086 [Festuca glaucescens]